MLFLQYHKMKILSITYIYKKEKQFAKILQGGVKQAANKENF